MNIDFHLELNRITKVKYTPFHNDNIGFEITLELIKILHLLIIMLTYYRELYLVTKCVQMGRGECLRLHSHLGSISAYSHSIPVTIFIRMFN